MSKNAAGALNSPQQAIRITIKGSLARLVREVAQNASTTPEKAALWLCSMGEKATRPKLRNVKGGGA